MIHQNLEKKLISFLLALTFLGMISIPFSVSAQVRTHLVVKGDTLWDICEKYYGDVELWPKLWQLNPFVTNPHMLIPGDVITLFEDVPFKGAVGRAGTGEGEKAVGKTDTGEGEKIEKPAEDASKAVALAEGVDLSGFTNLNTLGYLTPKKLKPLGHIFTSENGKLLLSVRDVVFVVFGNGNNVKPGTEFTIARTSPPVKHPLTGKKVGYIISFHGRLLVEKRAGIGFKSGEAQEKKNIFQAKILKVYGPVRPGDLLVPYEPVSACIQPTPSDEKIVENIVATKDQKILLGQNSVVYINRGFNKGIRRGQVFEVVRPHLFPDPEVKSGLTAYSAGNLFRKPMVVLPDIHLGTMVILESRPHTSTGTILSSKESIVSGAYIKSGFDTIDPTLALSMVPDCTLQ